MATEPLPISSTEENQQPTQSTINQQPSGSVDTQQHTESAIIQQSTGSQENPTTVNANDGKIQQFVFKNYYYV